MALNHAGSERRIYLVSCVSKKSSTPLEAKDFYSSPWFRKARAYVEERGCQWFILSAKYRLVDPAMVISDYDQTLSKMRVGERRGWAKEVLRQLEPHLDGVHSVVFLAGEYYRQHLEPALRQMGIEVSVPMKGLPIGKQLSWLKSHLGP